MKISKAVRDREIKRKANKIGSVIQSVVGEKRINFDMSWLRISPTSITTIPMEILNLLNNEFFKWHAGEIDALAGINAKRPDWPLILDSKEQFDLVMNDVTVPAKELGIIWTALQSTRAQLDETLECGDTLRENIKNYLECQQLRSGAMRANMRQVGKLAACQGSLMT